MLDRASGDCYLGCSRRTLAAINQHISGRQRAGAHVAFDVTTADVNISDIS